MIVTSKRARERSPELRLWDDAPSFADSSAEEIIVDSFAGGGGASEGIALALGRGPHIAINHDAEAIALHMANHPDAEHYREDVWHVDPLEATRGRRVGLMWLSPDCKHFSKAKGAVPVSPRVRGLAWVAVRWARAVRPRIIILENVEEFKTWGPLVKDTMRPDPKKRGFTFRVFVGRLRGLGYRVEWRELRGCDFGAPTMRRRLFLIARCDGEEIVWPEPTHGPGRAKPWRAAAECIDFDLPCPSIFNREKPLVEKTMRRIAMGMRRFVFENPQPYIVQYHSAKHARDDRARSLAHPIPTLDTSNRFGLVAPVLVPRYGEDPHRITRTGHVGQEPRCRSVEQPFPTIVPTANGAQLVAGFLAKHFGGHTTPGSALERPMDTIVQDQHALVTARCASGVDVSDEVRAFLVSYYSTQQRSGDLRKPMATVTPRDRFGLVEVRGAAYQLVDIGMRMLEPRELYRAQGFRESYRIDITHQGKPLSKKAQVRMVGNSVCPDIAAALVRANVGALRKEVAA